MKRSEKEMEELWRRVSREEVRIGGVGGESSQGYSGMEQRYRTRKVPMKLVNNEWVDAYGFEEGYRVMGRNVDSEEEMETGTESDSDMPELDDGDGMSETEEE